MTYVVKYSSNDKFYVAWINGYRCSTRWCKCKQKKMGGGVYTQRDQKENRRWIRHSPVSYTHLNNIDLLYSFKAGWLICKTVSICYLNYYKVQSDYVLFAFQFVIQSIVLKFCEHCCRCSSTRVQLNCLVNTIHFLPSKQHTAWWIVGQCHFNLGRAYAVQYSTCLLYTSRCV